MRRLVAPLRARTRTRAGLVMVKRIGTPAPAWPPTNRTLSTLSWRTTSTCPRASRKALVGAPPLGAARRLAQRSVRQYDRLREVELVVRLQRLAQRGAAHRLRPSGCRRQDERHEPQSPPRPPRPRHGCSWMSV